MGTISDYLEIKWLDHVFENTAFTVPSNIYIALSKADPTDDASGIDEPVGNGYARIVFNTWNAAATRTIKNNGVITFGKASGSWGTDITHYAIFDAITSGNMLAHGPLLVAKSIVDENTPSIGDMEIEVSVTTGGFSDYLSHEMLDHTFKVGSYIQPTIYVGLSKTIPTDAANVTEPGVGAYIRKACAGWNAAAAGATENTGVITFITPTASWGECVFATIHDAETTGNYLARGDITDQTPNTGDTVRFNIGALGVTLD